MSRPCGLSLKHSCCSFRFADYANAKASFHAGRLVIFKHPPGTPCLLENRSCGLASQEDGLLSARKGFLCIGLSIDSVSRKPGHNHRSACKFEAVEVYPTPLQAAPITCLSVHWDPSHLSKMICTLHENQIQKFRGKLSSTNFTWPRRPVATACLSQGFADIPSLRSETRSPRTAGMPPAMASTARARTLLTRSSCSQQKHPTRSSESHGRQTELFFFVPGELTCMSRRGLYRSMQRTQPWQKRSCEGHRAAEAHIQELAPLGGASQKHPAVSERSGSRSPARRENLRLHDKVTHA